MKKQTIQQLKNSLNAMQLAFDREKKQREESERNFYNSQNELRAAKESLRSAEAAREDAEQALARNRAAMLEYFMALSNPETAKDLKLIRGLQSEICSGVFGTRFSNSFLDKP